MVCCTFMISHFANLLFYYRVDGPSWLPSAITTDKDPTKMIAFQKELPKPTPLCQPFSSFDFDESIEDPDES